MNYYAQYKKMPRQQLPDNEKTESWAKDCVDACEGMVLIYNDNIRESRLNKQSNYNLYNGILDKKELEKISNPYNLQGSTFPTTPRNYPITNPYIKKLVGEEFNRRFDWHLAVINPDAISSKMAEMKEIINNKVIEIIQNQQKLTPEQLQDPKIQEQVQAEIQAEVEKVGEYRDRREEGGTKILEYYYRYLDLKYLFNKGWEDAIIAGEELYAIDEINSDPVVRRCNPLTTYFLTNPQTNRLEDSDIVVEEMFEPLGKIMDDYYKFLSPEDIKYLETLNGFSGRNTTNGLLNYNEPNVFLDYNENTATLSNNFQLNQGIDLNGNIRVLRCVWRSLRKINLLHYLDENGDEQIVPMHESYKPRKTKGEWVEGLWIGEFWEGTKIANKIYVKLKPRSIQFRKLNNLSYCQSGYVGTVYNTNSSRVNSLFDIMKPYQYSFIAMSYRTELAFIKAKGKIGIIDTAMIPDGMNVDTWMYYAELMGWAVTDSFKEGKKGAATGKLAANVANQAREINLDLGNYIQQHISYLQYIEAQLDKITGINNARRGDTPASAGLGVTQEAQRASSDMTEQYFRLHDNVKLRVLSAVLETAKYCLKKGSKTFQMILDDLSTEIFTVDGETINEAEYGILMSDATNDQDTLNTLKRAMEMAIQTGKVDSEQLLDITSNSSMSSIRRKIKNNIKETKKIQQEQFAKEQEVREQEIQAKLKAEQDKLALEYEKLNREDVNKQLDREVKIYESELKAYALDEGSATGNIQATADSALKQQEINLKSLTEQQKIEASERAAAMANKLKEKEIQAKKDVEAEKLNQVKIQNASQEAMQRKQEQMLNEELKFKREEIGFKKEELKIKERVELIKLATAKHKAAEAKKKAKAKPKAK
jgi:hypothetical protein